MIEKIAQVWIGPDEEGKSFIDFLERNGYTICCVDGYDDGSGQYIVMKGKRNEG